MKITQPKDKLRTTEIILKENKGKGKNNDENDKENVEERGKVLRSTALKYGQKDNYGWH